MVQTRSKTAPEPAKPPVPAVPKKKAPAKKTESPAPVKRVKGPTKKNTKRKST